MEGEPCGFAYQAGTPYPPVRAQGRNLRYGEMMLGNLAGRSSEMSAVALYFYDAVVTQQRPEVSEVFHHISIVEMHHLDIFSTLARQLGAEPRLWSGTGGQRSWWSPGYLSYAQRLGPLLQIAIREENAAIRRYESQARCIRDENVVENLLRIIEDERLHLTAFRCLWGTYGG